MVFLLYRLLREYLPHFEREIDMKEVTGMLISLVCLLWVTPVMAGGIEDFIGTWRFTGDVNGEPVVDKYHLAHVQTQLLLGGKEVTGLVGGDLEDGSPVVLIPGPQPIPNSFTLFEHDAYQEDDFPQCTLGDLHMKLGLFDPDTWKRFTMDHCLFKSFLFRKVGRNRVEGVIYVKTRDELEHPMRAFISPTAYPFTGRRE